MTASKTTSSPHPALSLDDRTIVGFDVWHVTLPVTSVRDHGIGAVGGEIDLVVLRLTSTCGAVGLGEASPWSVFTGSVEASLAALDRYIRPLVEGQPLANRHAMIQAANKVVAHCTEAKAALETALLDLVGRISGMRVADLLGGAVRERVPLSCSLANPDFNDDLALIETLVADKVGIVKLKAGFADHAFDVMRLETLRHKFPQLDIRVDFNQGLTPADALQRVQDIASFDPTFIEQPVAAPLFDLMARIHSAIDVPLLADESVFSAADMLRAIREDICDGVSVKIMKAGGLTAAQRIAAIAEAAGLSAYGGDMFESGLAHVAGLHMVAASPNITLGCEFYQARYYLTHDLLQNSFPIHEGHAVLPSGPGLGIEVDMDRLAHHTVAHRSTRRAQMT